MTDVPRRFLITLHPGDCIEVALVEPLENGYPDHVGDVQLKWQERDAPTGEIATQHRELQIRYGATRGRVGPVVVTNR